MKLKLGYESTNIHGLQVEMQPVLAHASKVWNNAGFDELVVTSGRDGIHSCGSYHYYGYAVDLRTWDHNDQQWPDALREQVCVEMRTRLAAYPGHYDVISHPTHIHIEFDWVKSQD